MFQSSPSPKAGSYSDCWCDISGYSWFQSSPSPKAGSYLTDTSLPASTSGFNPLPARRPGATKTPAKPLFLSPVSILSQPEGRELQGRAEHRLSPMRFQSSPSPKAGSYLLSGFCLLRCARFNPLPARRPGATTVPGMLSKDIEVSILSQPEGRELLMATQVILSTGQFQSSPSPKAGSYGYPSHVPDTPASVSILSQPEGRELLYSCSTKRKGTSFQSSPSPKAGSYGPKSTSMPTNTRFQSSPSPKAGSYSLMDTIPSALVVSILSQPEGRELQWNWAAEHEREWFQSSPSPKAGSYRDLPAVTLRLAVSILSQPEGRELP